MVVSIKDRIMLKSLSKVVFDARERCCLPALLLPFTRPRSESQLPEMHPAVEIVSDDQLPLAFPGCQALLYRRGVTQPVWRLHWQAHEYK